MKIATGRTCGRNQEDRNAARLIQEFKKAKGSSKELLKNTIRKFFSKQERLELSLNF